MAGQSGNLTVTISSAARRSLDEIWEWNASTYGVVHADRYIQFILTRTQAIAATPTLGRPVPTMPDKRYLIMRRRRKGHGHLAVYQRNGDVIQVLQYYHTAQDWQRRLETDIRP